MRIPQNVKRAIDRMFLCDNLKKHLKCYQDLYDDLKDCTFIVFSEDEGTKLPNALCTNFDNEFAIINIGYANSYYAVNQQIFEEMIQTGRADYYIDICVQLDTQAVSYLKNIFIDYNQIASCDRNKNLIEYLQLPEVNYSCVPYLIENAAKKDVINKIDCYKNIKSFMLFKSFNYLKFIQKGLYEYNKLEEEIQIDTDGLFSDMFSEKFVKGYKDYYRMQDSIYALLLKAVCIEFSNSQKSAPNKMKELFDFVNEELGFIAERELEVCYYYFMHHDKTKKFFKKVQKNNKSLLSSINGMAWDLIHIRFIEQEFANKPIDEVRFAIHVLLTYDDGLKGILQINPVEQIALYKGTPIVKLRHFWVDEIPEAKVQLFSDENRRRRCQTFEMVNIDELKMALENEVMSFSTNAKRKH